MGILNAIKKEVQGQINLILPMCFTFLLRKSIDIISVIFVGHLGSRYLSASGLATVTANVTGNSMIIGLAGALSTICSQLYGAKTKSNRAINIVLPRSILIICTVVTIPVSLLWFHGTQVLLLFGQQHQISSDAGDFLIRLIPGLWALTFSNCIQNWLYSQSKTTFVLGVTIVVALCHPVFCYVFIYKLNYGYIGAAIASSLSKILELSMLLVFMRCKSTFQMEWSMTVFHDWLSFLQLG